MQIDRLELLKKLLAVSPGLTAGKDPVQGNCVVIRRGRFYTFNEEVACSIISGLDPEMEGVIAAGTLTNLIKKLTENELDFDIVGKQLIVAGKGRKVKLNMEEEAFLPVDAVEKPGEWQKLVEGWSDAIDVVHRCTYRGSKERDKDKKIALGKRCVHVSPTFIEASDNDRMARWNLKTFVAKSVMIRGTTLKEIVPLGMTKGCETKGWLHFKNPMGLRVSLRKWPLEEFAPLDEYLELRGERVVFPKGIADAADRAGLLLDEKEGSVRIKLSKERLILSSEGVQGEYEEEKQVSYDGRPMTFMIPPKLIGELVDKHTVCEVSEVSLRVDGGSYIYVTSLEIA